MLTLSPTSRGDTGGVIDVTVPPDASLNIQADSATIHFAGSLDTNSTYQFATQTGSISISVPANSRATVALLAYDGAVAIQKS
jgi:hypothetical protein